MASTHIPKKGDITRKWHIVDASGQTLGRLASRVARILAGKESTQYTPFIDAGDHVIVINAEKVKLTGEKADKKVYHRITGYPGGLRTESYKKKIERRPVAVVEDAIVGMLPHTKLDARWRPSCRSSEVTSIRTQAQKPEALAL